MTDWPTCQDKGCSGIQTKGYNRCLAHMSSETLGQFLATLKPGSQLDARGTTISSGLFTKLMDAVREDTVPRFGQLDFTAAVLEVEEFGHLEADVIILHRARFMRWVWMNADANQLSCLGARFDEGVSLQGIAEVNFSEVTLGSTSRIANVKVLSFQATDVSNLILNDVDLRNCLFVGVHGLDRLRIEGTCLFKNPAGRWRTRRRMLVEEGQFREEYIEGLYRSLRKAFEDSKNEAGAGDFYYGEMEMRRRSPKTPWAERLILTGYWLLSGYGQRAGRAIVALGVLVGVVFVLLMTVGLPGEHIWTWARVDQSARIAMGAVVFREAGQQLTSAGNWTVMIARFLGPFLLILAALAVRARVKR